MRQRRLWIPFAAALASVGIGLTVAHLGRRAMMHTPGEFLLGDIIDTGAFDTEDSVFVMRDKGGRLYCTGDGDNNGELEFTIVFEASLVRAYRSLPLPFGGERFLREECTGRAWGGVGNRKVPVPDGVMKNAARIVGKRHEFIGVTTPWRSTSSTYRRTAWNSIAYLGGSWGGLVVGTIAFVVGCGHLLRAVKRGLRVRAGQCEWCKYDRRGLATDAACPECGTPRRSPP